MTTEHKTGVAIAATIFVVVFGEALGELVARYLVEIGCVLIVAGVLVFWWNSYVD